MKPPPQWAIDLVGALEKLARPEDPDRAALALLRRGLSTDPAHVLAQVGWLFRAVPDHAVRHALLVAGLFALSKLD